MPYTPQLRPSPPSARPPSRDSRGHSSALDELLAEELVEPPPPERPPEMAAKKKRTRSPEAIAKFKATLAAKKAKKKRAKKKASARPAYLAPESESASVTVEALDGFVASLEALVRITVRQEIRRMFS